MCKITRILLTPFLFTVFLAGGGLFAQISVSGTILSSRDSSAVPGTHIIINGTVATTTNSNGSFSFTVKRLPVFLTISHVAFIPRQVEINEKSNRTRIFIQQKTISLPQYEVSAIPQHNLIKNKKLYVTDYAFQGNDLVLLSYKNRKTNQSALILINDNGDTLKSCSLQLPDFIYSDCFGINHLIDNHNASQIFIDENDIKLLYKIQKDSFLQIFKSIIGYDGRRFYIRRNELQNQVVSIYVFDTQDTAFHNFATITDDAGLERLSDKARLQSSKGYSFADARFEEMCFYNEKPVELLIRNDSILIFNPVDCCIEIFDTTGRNMANINAGFFNSRHWDKKILQDKITGRIYTQFTKGGITTIAEIDIKNGKTGKRIKIPQMNFVQNIKINNNKIYFLYNDTSNYSYKQIYSMNITR